MLLNLSDYIKGIQDPDKSITTVKYIPETFKRYIISDEFYELLSTKHKVFTVLDHVKYSELIKENFNDIDFYNLDSISGNLEKKRHSEIKLYIQYLKNYSKPEQVQKIIRIFTKMKLMNS